MKRAFSLVFLLLVAPAPVQSIQNSFVAFSYEVEVSPYFGSELEVDSEGNIYMIGSISSGVIPLVNAYQTLIAGGSDIVIVSLDAEGDIRWSTYFGGSEDDIIHKVEIDAQDNIYLIGDTDSQDFPILDAFDRNFSRNEGFIVSFTRDGELRWSSYLGGSKSDYILGSVVGENSLLVVGESSSEDYPLMNPLQGVRRGLSDGVISEISFNGDLLWSTYLGDNGTEVLLDITITGDDIFVVGEEFYPDETLPYYESEDIQAIVYKVALRNTVTRTVINGSSNDYGRRILSDNSGNIFIGGRSGSSDIFENVGGLDIFVARFNNNLERTWLASFGDVKDDYLKDMILQPDGSILLSAKYDISTKNLTGGYYTEPLGWSDIVLMSINESAQINWASYFGGESFDNPHDLLYRDGIIYLSVYSSSSNLPNEPGNRPVSSWFLYGIYSPYEDPDNDTLLSIDENRLGTDPGNADTDGDGIPDNIEIENGSDPLVPDTTNDRVPLLLSGFVMLLVLRRRRVL